jgi:hypothetical protein
VSAVPGRSADQPAAAKPGPSSLRKRPVIAPPVPLVSVSLSDDNTDDTVIYIPPADTEMPGAGAGAGGKRKRPRVRAHVTHSESSDEASHVSDQEEQEEHELSSNPDDLPDIYNWRAARMEDPNIPIFTGAPGIQVNTHGFSPISYLYLFITNQTLDSLVLETNRYAQQFITSEQIKQHSRVTAWHPTAKREIKIFLGLLLLMGIIKKPTIESYWSINPLYSTPIFRVVMLRNRFQLILKFLHFNNNELEPAGNDPDRDRLFKIRPLVDSLFDSFQNVYIPDKNICVDEELLLWKGRLLFKQYLPLKAARFGIKLYCLCETSGYTYRFRIYTGKEDRNQVIAHQVPADAAQFSKTEKIVIHLAQPLLDKGYHIYMDNFYTSVRLFSYLDKHNTGACGTIRANRIPPIVKNKHVPVGDVAAFRSHNLLCVKFRDKKDVHVLTTLHKETRTRKRKRGRRDVYVNKPDCVLDYNVHMGGVDKLDQLIQPYESTRKSLKWYKKLAIHLITVAMFNAFLLYQKDGGKLTFLKYQMEVIGSLIFSSEMDQNIPMQEHVARLAERHFLQITDTTSVVSKNQRKVHKTKRCRVCYKKGIRKESIYMCKQCPSGPGLCPVPCFELYHSQINYWE